LVLAIALTALISIGRKQKVENKVSLTKFISIPTQIITMIHASVVIGFLVLSGVTAFMPKTLSNAAVKPAFAFVENAVRSKPLTSLRMSTPQKEGGLPNISEKLVYDPKGNRFFERDIDEICEEEFCLVDSTNGSPILLTKEEKERIFLDSIQTYYLTGKPNLSDKQFDKLREDLSWEGSVLVTLNRNEAMFLNAMGAYMKGAPILSDKEFDELKATLKEQNSPIAVSTEPQCYVDTGVCKVNWTEDKLRTSSLYLPVSFVLILIWEGVLYELLEPFRSFNPLITLAVGYLPGSVLTKQITENIIFKNPLVASGPCPSCEVENSVFFGDVLGVEGDMEESTIKCRNCKCSLTIKRNTLRVSTLPTSKQAKKPAPVA